MVTSCLCTSYSLGLGGGGWLGQMGVYDFAGGIVVHITAGTAALVAAIVVGPRRGFPKTPMFTPII